MLYTHIITHLLYKTLNTLKYVNTLTYVYNLPVFHMPHSSFTLYVEIYKILVFFFSEIENIAFYILIYWIRNIRVEIIILRSSHKGLD